MGHTYRKCYHNYRSLGYYHLLLVGRSGVSLGFLRRGLRGEARRRRVGLGGIITIIIICLLLLLLLIIIIILMIILVLIIMIINMNYVIN